MNSYIFLLCLLPTLRAESNEPNLALNKEVGGYIIDEKSDASLGVDGNLSSYIKVNPKKELAWYYISLGESHQIEKVWISSGGDKNDTIRVYLENSIPGTFDFSSLKEQCRLFLKGEKLERNQNFSCTSNKTHSNVIIVSTGMLFIFEIQVFGKKRNSRALTPLETTKMLAATRTETIKKALTISINRNEQEKESYKVLGFLFIILCVTVSGSLCYFFIQKITLDLEEGELRNAQANCPPKRGMEHKGIESLKSSKNLSIQNDLENVKKENDQKSQNINQNYDEKEKNHLEDSQKLNSKKVEIKSRSKVLNKQSKAIKVKKQKNKLNKHSFFKRKNKEINNYSKKEKVTNDILSKDVHTESKTATEKKHNKKHTKKHPIGKRGITDFDTMKKKPLKKVNKKDFSEGVKHDKNNYFEKKKNKSKIEKDKLSKSVEIKRRKKNKQKLKNEKKLKSPKDVDVKTKSEKDIKTDQKLKKDFSESVKLDKYISFEDKKNKSKMENDKLSKSVERKRKKNNKEKSKNSNKQKSPKDVDVQTKSEEDRETDLKLKNNFSKGVISNKNNSFEDKKNKTKIEKDKLSKRVERKQKKNNKQKSKNSKKQKHESPKDEDVQTKSEEDIEADPYSYAIRLLNLKNVQKQPF